MSGKKHRQFRKMVKLLAEGELTELPEIQGGFRQRHVTRAFLNTAAQIPIVQDYKAHREREVSLVRPFKMTKGPEFYRLRAKMLREMEAELAQADEKESNK